MHPWHALDPVFAAWSRLGIGFTIDPQEQEPDLEKLILATAAAAPKASRLLSYPVEWLVTHGNLVDFDRLIRLLADHAEHQPEVAVICSEVLRLGGHHGFEAVMRACSRAKDPKPFLECMRRSHALADVEFQDATPQSRWYGRWLTPIGIRKNPGVFESAEWILANNPRLAERPLHTR